MATLIVSGIYAIRNQVNGKVYIGSALDITLRWIHHRKRLRRGAHHSRFLQRAWDKYGEHSFTLVIVEEVPDPTQLIVREQHWIDTYKTVARSYNACPIAGSTLGRRHTDEARAKMRALRSTPEARAANRERQLGRPRSEEQKARHRATLDTPECRERMRLAHLGRKATPEEIEKNRLKQLGRKHSTETKEKIRAASLKHRHSEETKFKLSSARKGIPRGPFSPEHIAKIRAAKIGFRHSEETKAKLRVKAQQRPPRSAETRAKLSALLKGRVKTPEHIAKIKAAKRAKKEAIAAYLQPRLL